MARAPRKKHPEVRSEVVKVGPDLAVKWLEKNVKNRKPITRKINEYARDMAAGKWLLTGEAIKFDYNDVLLDGQNRLYAVIQSGTTVEFLVVFGLNPEAQDVMDVGSARLASQMLVMHGYKNAVPLAGGISLAINWTNGMIASSRQSKLTSVTHSECRAFAETHPTIVDSAQIGKSLSRDIPASASVLTFAHWAIADHGTYHPALVNGNGTAGMEFFLTTAEMQTDGRGDPRFTLMRRLQGAKNKNEDMNGIGQSFLIFRAWNAWSTKQELARLELGPQPTGTPFPREGDL